MALGTQVLPTRSWVNEGLSSEEAAPLASGGPRGWVVSSCGPHSCFCVFGSEPPSLPRVLVCWEPESLPVTPGVRAILGVMLRRPSAQAWAHGGTQGLLLRLLWQLATSSRALWEPLM